MFRDMERIVGVQKDRVNVENISNVKGFVTDYPANLPCSYLPGVTYNQSFAPPLSHRVYPPLRRTGNLSSGSDSAFSPVKSTKSDEHLVSSSAEDVHRNKRGGSHAPSDVDWREAQSPEDQGLPRIGQVTGKDEFPPHPQRTDHNKTETAAATSTTSGEDDEERLRMQNQGSRGRRGAIGAVDHRPPSCGTPLGKISEETNSSKKIPGYNSVAPGIPKDNDIYKQRNDGFLAPMAPDDVTRLNNHQHPHDADTHRRSGNFFIQPHIPVDSKIRDGRYPFDPRQLSMPEEIAGPALPDISRLPISPHSPLLPPVNGASGVFMGQRSTGNAPLDLYMRSLTSPTISILSQARGLSPRHSIQGREGEQLPYPYYGNPATSAPNISAIDAPSGQVSGNCFQNGHPQSSFNTMAYQLAQHQSWLAAVASAGGVDRSLAMSIDRSGDMSRLSSPFCMRRQGRKRALSISPSQSDISLDLMIRTSPNSLLPFANGVGNSRGSSIGSAGSYGHLSARGISPQMSFHTQLVSPMHTQLLSNRLAAASAGFSPGILGGMAGPATAMNQSPRPQSQFHPGPFPNATKHMSQHHTQLAMVQHQDVLSNKAEKHQPHYHGIIKTEPHSPAVTTASRTHHANLSRNQDETETVYETNCGWENCLREFDTQEQLVHHINNDHIHGEKKEFVCRWRDCARDQKPFKAQYMLVVHMRRHTGEKPHTCSFEGCTKAYSRLENLKTHLRSHTGEKPYVCEYPGCIKAFSNASDRAKHQNRTHSNEKPYVCKIPNCTKRYTDPSSLRKHVKTVHGPDAHVTKRMKAEKKRKDAIQGDDEEGTIKQEDDSAESRAEKDENNNSSGQSCRPSSRGTQQSSHDTNTPGNANPRSNHSSCTSGSDMSGTPQNSPHANPQHNNDSGVEVNTAFGNDHDSDGDIVVDGNPLPDSTSGGVGVQSRRRTSLRSNFIPRMVNQKMQSLSLVNAAGSLPSLGPDALGDLLPNFSNPKIESGSGNSPYLHYSPRSIHSGTNEVSSTTLSSPQSHARPQSKSNVYAKTQHSGLSPLYRQAMLAPDRRDSGTSSGYPSRKPSGISNASRRSSQASNQLPVAGSYDPISLGSSRKSSGISIVPGNGGSASSPSLPSLNPYTLHLLTSKFNEVTGRPPPTPLDRDTYTRSQLGKWLQEDAAARAQGGLSNPSNVPQQPNNSDYLGNMGPPVSIPPHHRHINATVLPNRRRSDAPFQRGVHTPLPREIPNNGNRRASDPIKKPSQHPDPNRLPNVQRYYSWNNMNPLPGIRNFHNQSSQMYNSQGGMPANFGYNNFLSSGNLQAGRQRSDSNGSFFSSESGYQSNGSNLALNCAAEYQNSSAQSHPEGTGGQCYNPNHPGRNHLQSVHNFPPPTGVNENLFQENLNADMMTAMEEIFQNDQAQGYMNPTTVNAQQKQLQQQHGPYGAPEMFQQNYAQQPYHQFLQTPNHSGYGENDGGQAPNYGVQDAYHHGQTARASAVVENPGGQTYSQSSQGYYNQNYANQYPPRVPIAPRPPLSSNSAGVANVNRHRMARMRNPNQRVKPASTSEVQGPGQIDTGPDTEIPISYLQQEFIDSIPTFRVPESFGDTETNRGYVKMPADSTTGPEGGEASNEPRLRRPPEMDDNFDVMSGTNTDVTLPSMSGLSSRLATPTFEKPYSVSFQQQEINEQMALNVAECWDVSPTANMALNSMSSMLSTLAEENRFLQMMPQ